MMYCVSRADTANQCAAAVFSHITIQTVENH